MKTDPAAPVVELALTDDRRWAAWVAKGAARDRLVHGRLIRVAAVVAGGLLAGALLALALG